MKILIFILVLLWYGVSWAAGAKSIARDMPTGTSSGTVQQLDLETGVVTIDGLPMALAPSAQAELRRFIQERGSLVGMPVIFQLKKGVGSRIVEHLAPIDERETDY